MRNTLSALTRNKISAGLVPVLLLGGALHAQSFDTRVALRNLDMPTGLFATASGDVYFTEVPEPGTMGGNNRVSLKDGATGAVSQLSMGEPEPVNITRDPTTGDVYWTCRSAGVVLRLRNGQTTPILRGLSEPTGISAPGNGRLYLTQIPTPGIPGSRGGTNTVDVVDLATGNLTNLSSGEPEPFDIVADGAGNAYWTCRTAGVILRRNATTGTTSVLLDDLADPAGIALDAAGRLYFTEVPSPGTAGADNKVWQFDPSNSNLTLISDGEPEPIDISVTPDGSSVYWTCRTAGVILRAERTGTQPRVTSSGPFDRGSTVRLFVDAGASAGGRMYVAASSTGLGPIRVGDRLWALEMDGVFSGTFANPGTASATGYVGLLDANGMATAHLVVPNLQALVGLDVYTSAAVIDLTAPLGVEALASTHRFEIR